MHSTGLSNDGLCTIATSFYFRLYNLTAILSLKLSSKVVLNLNIVTSVYENCIGIYVKYTFKCMNIKFICMNVLRFFVFFVVVSGFVVISHSIQSVIISNVNTLCSLIGLYLPTRLVKLTTTHFKGCHSLQYCE